MAFPNGTPPIQPSFKSADASPLADSKKQDSKQAAGFRGAPPEGPRVSAPSLPIAETTKRLLEATPFPKVVAQLVAQYYGAPPAPAVLHGHALASPAFVGHRIDCLLEMHEDRPTTVLIGAGGLRVPMRIVSKEGAYVTVAIPNQSAVALGLIARSGEGHPAEDVPFVFDLKQGNLDFSLDPPSGVYDAYEARRGP